MNHKMTKRILYGAAMIAGLTGFFYLEWRLFVTEAWFKLVQSVAVNPLSLAPFTILVLLVVVAAFFELSRMLAGTGAGVLKCAGLFGVVALAAMPFWTMVLSIATIPLGMSKLGQSLRLVPTTICLLFLTMVFAFAEQMIRYRTQEAIRRLGCTLLVVLYLGIGGALLLAIRDRFTVAGLVLFLVAVKFTDIGAYFTGSAIGRHKMIPWLSPGKSWEGLAGGLVVAAGASVLANWWFMMWLAPWEAALFGVIVGLAGQFGDLCESLLKRSADIKDSGALVPEFGGILDLIDSPLLAAPVAYLLLTIL